MKLTLLDLSDAKASLQMSSEGASTLANPSAGLIEALIGFPTAAGKPVTRETAVRVASFLSGVKMLCNDIAKMPLIMMETTLVKGTQRTRRAIDNPLYSILKDVPNPWMTSYQMRWLNAFHLITNGNFYNQIVKDGKGDVLALNPLNSWNVVHRWDFSGTQPQLFFDYDDGRGNKRSFKQGEVWHCSIMNLNGVEGQAIIALAKEALALLMASDETAGRYFANGLNMAGFLSSPADADIDEKQAQDIVDRLKKDFAGTRNAGKFSFLPGGVKYEKMAFSAVEGQLLESRKWNAEEVIRLLGGAPLLVKLGYGDKNATYASSSAFLDEYFNTSLLPFTVNIEQTITRDLIDPKDRGSLYAKHNADIILRGSPKERAETYKIQISSGQRTPNETRILDDCDPIEGWDKLFFPSGSGVFDPKTGEIFIPKQQSPDESPAEDEQDTEPESPSEDAQDSKATARLLALANSLADRVLRKETKGGTVDAKFIADVMSVSLDKAEEYCQKRKAGEITEENAKAALIALAQGE